MFEVVLITVAIVLSLSLVLTVSLLWVMSDYMKGLDFDFTEGFSSLDDKPSNSPSKTHRQRLDIEV